MILDLRSSTERLGCERLHRHDYAVVTVVESGFILLRSGDLEVKIGAGMICLIPAGVVHQVLEMSPDFSRVHVLSLSCSLLDDRGDALRGAMIVEDESRYRRFLEWVQSGDLLSGVAEGVEPHLFFRFLEGCGVLVDVDGDLQTVIPSHWVARRIKELLDAGAEIDGCFLQIEAQMSFSREHCNRLFKRFHGITIQAYSLNARAERARVLLKGDLTLAEVAVEAGFYDQSQLTRVFKSVFQLTPGAYRKQIGMTS
ncbi:helix-turn-helix transcriptional regulator [Verrucomicrobiaceae bacterium 227]